MKIRPMTWIEWMRY